MPTATAKGSDMKPVPAGIHHAVCYAVIDLGTQPSQMFSPSRKVLLCWELPHERGTFFDKEHQVERDLPRAISKEYTLSTSTKSNLRRDLESWRGRPFTPEEAKAFEVGVLVGHNCQVNVAHKPSKDGTKTYANVVGVVPLGKGQPKLKPENPTMVYDLPKSGKIDLPAGMPEWIQNKIKCSEEYSHPSHRQEQQHDPVPGDPPEDETVPF